MIGSNTICTQPIKSQLQISFEKKKYFLVNQTLIRTNRFQLSVGYQQRMLYQRVILAVP